MIDIDDKVSILLVDDRPEKLLALEAVLEDLGQTIVRAYSGREALRQILAQEFAVILLDVNMPGMDGFETAELIRQRKSSQHIPIIFITAMGDEIHAQRGYRLGAVDYILAPVVPEVLRSKVVVFVDLLKKTRQVQRQAESLRRRATQLQQLTAASVTINSAVSTERMLQTVTDTAREVIGAHQAITLFLSASSENSATKTHSFTSFSEKYEKWRSEKLELDPIGQTLVARSPTPTRLTLSELHEHPDWEIVKKINLPPVHGGMLAVPLTGRSGNNLGVIYLADRYEGDFTSDDEAILVQLSQMASIAVENAIYAQEREANRIKDEFLSTLSHELRTPLNAILGWTQLLKLEKLGEDTSHGLDVIDRNARAQTKLIEDLLDVSRINTGKLRLNLKIVNPVHVASSAVDAIRPTAESKRLQLELIEDAGSAEVNGDPDRLQQVVWNLLSNAVKFTPSGGKISVSLDRLNGHLRISVRDTGQGIEASFLPFVFDRFRQGDSTSTRTHGGLGIGLTIVRKIVEMHGGTVTAESSGKGMGSTFTVLLPISSKGAVPTNASPASEKPAERPDLHGLTILVVDDEPDAREVISQIIERAGAQVSSAGCVKEAIEAFRRVRPDILVSDIAMPDHDGYSLIRAIRLLQHSDGGGTPAVALTAYAREEDRAAALSAGFQRHLSKPCEPAELLVVLAELANMDISEQQPVRMRAG